MLIVLLVLLVLVLVHVHSVYMRLGDLYTQLSAVHADSERRRTDEITQLQTQLRDVLATKVQQAPAQPAMCRASQSAKASEDFPHHLIVTDLTTLEISHVTSNTQLLDIVSGQQRD